MVSTGAVAATSNGPCRGGALVRSPDHGAGGIDSGVCAAAVAVCSQSDSQIQIGLSVDLNRRRADGQPALHAAQP